jgi:hypothetical protein
VTLRAIQATVERRDRPRASVTWASALTAGAVSVSVVNPAAAQLRSGWLSVFAPILRRPASIVRQVERAPFLSSPRGSIRNSFAANTAANWRKST